MTTRIGVLLPTREAVIYGDRTGDPRPLVELAVRAEGLGLDAVWAGDSLLARPRAEPLTLLAAVASVTERVQLGTGVLLPALRNAEQLAQAAATLDAVSGGRLILGIGAGPGTPGVLADHEHVGTSFERRASGAMAVAERARELWRGDGGEQMYPLPISAGGPPIWYGGDGPRMLARTGAGLDGWLGISPPDRYARSLAAVREAAEAAGRAVDDVSVGAYLTVVFGEQREAAARLAEHSELYYGIPHEVIATQQASVAGPPELVGQWIRTYIDAGAEHLCIRIGCDDVAGQLETLAGLLGDLRR